MQQAYNKITLSLIEGINQLAQNKVFMISLVVLGIVTLIGTSGQFAQAHHMGLPEFMPYGSVGQEDELTANVNGDYYVNIVLGKGNGQFMLVDYIIDQYTAKGAYKMFGVTDHKDFIVEPSYAGFYSNVLFMYKWDGNNYNLIHIYNDDSGLDQFVTIQGED